VGSSLSFRTPGQFVGQDVFGSYEPGCPCPSIALHIDEEEPGTSPAIWRIELSARSETGGTQRLGSVLTTRASWSADHYRRPAARTVLLACCPGAIGWSARVVCVAVAAGLVGRTSTGAIWSWSDSPIAVAPGIHPINAREVTRPWLFYSTNVVGGGLSGFNPNPGEAVESILCWQIGDGGILRVNPFQPGPAYTASLPPNGSINLSPDGNFPPDTPTTAAIVLDLTANVAGKGGLIVEYRR
jgi:hypothetical protein